MLSIEVSVMSDPGGRERNEDACGYWRSERQLCCVLADGAGGHGGGDRASHIAVESLLGQFANARVASGAELAVLMRQTNRAVLDGRLAGTELEDMHTTAVCLVIDFHDGRADWAHAGDSRLYWFRGGRLIERTRDHSLVSLLMDSGHLREDESRAHPNRNVLLSALGRDEEDLELSSSPSSRIVDGGDVFLLCSDGVWELLTDEELENLLQQATAPQDWLDAIEAAIRKAVTGLKTYDNYTALTVWLSGNSDVSPLDIDRTVTW